MATTKIFPVIMSGGSGTRLWPLSTENRPKQFHPLGGAKSMIEQTALRLSGQHGDIEFLAPVVIAVAGHRQMVRELLAESGIGATALVFEPKGRNTAATAALAALIVQELDPEAMVLLMPADHIVTKPSKLAAIVGAAARVASDRIVTFGITPSHPETGYGYIKQGASLGEGVFEVAAFKEKPNQDVAEGYIEEGGYSWNSGIFYFKPQVMLQEFAIASADIRDGSANALKLAVRKGNEIDLDAATFTAVRAEPVDIAVMEKTRRAAVAPCEIGWADIGSWAELWRLSDRDEGQNVVSGSVSTLDATGNLVRAEGIHVSVIGVSDLVIVATPEAVLVMPRDRAQDVKKVIPGKE